MPHDQEAVEQTKRDCRNDEQIHRRDAVGMIIEKCFPALGWRPSTPGHILGYAGLADIDAELENSSAARDRNSPTNEPEKIPHYTTASPDSRSAANQMRFPTRTVSDIHRSDGSGLRLDGCRRRLGQRARCPSASRQESPREQAAPSRWASGRHGSEAAVPRPPRL